MDHLPTYDQAARERRPPPYQPTEHRRIRYNNRTRTISFPIELETTYRARCHWRITAERHRERVELHRDTSFESLQRKLREKHRKVVPDARSFTWTTWLKYANGQKRQVRSDNWERMLGKITTVGSMDDQPDARRGDFPVSLVTQSNEMSVDRWQELRRYMAYDRRGWGEEGWKGYLLQRGYWFQDKPLTKEAILIRQERENDERRYRERQEKKQRREQNREERRARRREGRSDGEQDERHGVRKQLARLFHIG